MTKEVKQQERTFRMSRTELMEHFKSIQRDQKPAPGEEATFRVSRADILNRFQAAVPPQPEEDSTKGISRNDLAFLRESSGSFPSAPKAPVAKYDAPMYADIEDMDDTGVLLDDLEDTSKLEVILEQLGLADQIELVQGEPAADGAPEDVVKTGIIDTKRFATDPPAPATLPLPSVARAPIPAPAVPDTKPAVGPTKFPVASSPSIPAPTFAPPPAVASSSAHDIAADPGAAVRLRPEPHVVADRPAPVDPRSASNLLPNIASPDEEASLFDGPATEQGWRVPTTQEVAGAEGYVAPPSVERTATGVAPTSDAPLIGAFAVGVVIAIVGPFFAGALPLLVVGAGGLIGLVLALTRGTRETRVFAVGQTAIGFIVSAVLFAMGSQIAAGVATAYGALTLIALLASRSKT